MIRRGPGVDGSPPIPPCSTAEIHTALVPRDSHSSRRPAIAARRHRPGPLDYAQSGSLRRSDRRIAARAHSRITRRMAAIRALEPGERALPPAGAHAAVAIAAR
jgi:hypothetical protein